MKGSGIYKISNVVTGKVYIGSAIEIGNRWAVHKYQLRNKLHASKHLQNSWSLHGEDNFKFEIIEFCTAEEFKTKEQCYMDLYDSCNIYKGYNLAPYARTTFGYKHSEEIKALISIAARNYHRRNGHPARDKVKWPHEKGSKCKCEECREKVNSYNRSRYKNKRNSSNV